MRRGGLDVEGVLIGADGRPGQVGIVGGVEVPLEWVRDPSPGSAGLSAQGGALAQDVRATLPWSAVAQWPEAAALSARTADGESLPVIGPGLPVTVAPTDRRAVVVGWDEQAGVVRRVVAPDPIPVTGRLTSLRASVGEDVTVLSEVPIARARVVGSSSETTTLDVTLLPGLALTDGTELAVAAGAGDRAVRVGRFRLTRRACRTRHPGQSGERSSGTRRRWPSSRAPAGCPPSSGSRWGAPCGWPPRWRSTRGGSWPWIRPARGCWPHRGRGGPCSSLVGPCASGRPRRRAG